MKTRIRLSTKKGPVLCGAVVAVLTLIAFGWVLFRPMQSPVPAHIKQQVGFSILYPAGSPIDPTSWRYLPSQSTISFTAHKDGFSVIFTEQEVPLAFQDDTAAYDRFIGSLHPFANFQTNLGNVSLIDFVTATDFQPAGQAGILNAKGTLLLVHPDRELSEDEWRDLFRSIRT